MANNKPFLPSAGNQSYSDYGSIQTPIGSVPTERLDLYGRGGLLRHSGTFSSTNPYLEQMKQATRNQDIDSLYAKAIDYESNLAQDNYEYEKDRAILEEQRSYDHPLAQVGRYKSAGINLDVQGSSGGSSSLSSGSSAQMQESNLADVQDATPFSNAYDNIDKGLNIVNTAVNVATSAYNLSVGFGTLKDTLQQSHNVTKRDNVFTDRYPTILDAQGFSLDSANAVKASAIQSKYNSWSDIISNFDFADADNPTTQDIEALYNTLGLYTDGEREEFNNYIGNGKAIRKIKDEVLARRKADAEFITFTGDYMQKLVSANAQANLSKAIADANYSSLDESLSQYLKDREDDYVKAEGATIMNNAEAESSRSQLSRQRAEFNLERYKQLVEYRTNYAEWLWDASKAIDTTTNEGRATYQLLNSTRLQIITQMAEELPRIHGLYQRAMQANFFAGSALGVDNQINWTDTTFNEAVNGFYSQLFSGNDGGGFDLVGALTNMLSQIGSALVFKRVPAIR